MSKARWRLGSYNLKYNPKGYSEDKSSIAGVNINANGMVTTNNPYYDNNSEFMFDVYQKPSYFDKAPFLSFTDNTYQAIAEKRMSGEIFCLRGNVVEVFNENGSKARQFTVNTVAGGTPVTMTVTDDRILVFYSNGVMVVQAENNIEYGKYTYSGNNDFTTITSIAFKYDTHDIYALNRYGRIYLLKDNSASWQMVFQFADYDLNKTSSNSMYGGIYITGAYIGVIKDHFKIHYLNSNYEIVHGVELDTQQQVLSICYGFYSYKTRVLTKNKIYNAYIDTCGIDIDMILQQIAASGVLWITNDYNISKLLAISGINIRRLRNKQDARFEVTITGKIM